MDNNKRNEKSQSKHRMFCTSMFDRPGWHYKCIFNSCLKATEEFEFFRSSGSLFHSVGPVQKIEKSLMFMRA